MRMRSLGMIRSSLAVLIVSTPLLPGEARSQEQPNSVTPLGVGSKVRLLAPTAIQGRVQGTVMAMDEKSLLLSTEDQRPLSVPRPAITQIEVSLGRRRHTREGLILGASFGALLGAVLPLESNIYCSVPEPTAPCSLGVSRSELIASAVLGYAAVGAAIGHWAIKTDRWSSVPLDTLRISLAPTGGRGLRLSLSLRF